MSDQGTSRSDMLTSPVPGSSEPAPNSCPAHLSVPPGDTGRGRARATPGSQPHDALLWAEGLCPYAKSYVKTLIPSMMASGNGAFGGRLGLHEVVRVGPHNGINTLIRRKEIFLHVHVVRTGHVNTVKRWPSANQESGPHRALSTLARSSWACRLQNHEK